jgi:hypothetical protein
MIHAGSLVVKKKKKIGTRAMTVAPGHKTA